VDQGVPGEAQAPLAPRPPVNRRPCFRGYWRHAAAIHHIVIDTHDLPGLARF
jgi:hypothetical protein